MENLLTFILVSTIINFAILFFVTRWIFRINKIVSTLEEISEKISGLTVIQNRPEKERTAEKSTEQTMEEKYGPKA